MNDENLTLEELNDEEKRKREREEIAREAFEEGRLLAKYWNKQQRREMLMFPIRLVFFPVMLLVKLFKWTYDYKD